MSKSLLALFFLAGFSFSYSFAQDIDYQDPEGLYVQPLYTTEMIVSSGLDADNNSRLSSRINFDPFMALGGEIGYYSGFTSYGVQLKYGSSLSSIDLQDEGVRDGEKRLDSYLHIGVVFNDRMLGTKAKSTYQLQLGYRASLGYTYFSGEEYTQNETNPNGSVNDTKDHEGSVEFGISLKTGFRPSPQNAILLILEPVNLQLNTLGGFALGFARLGVAIQF